MKTWFCVGYKLNIAARHRECLFFLFPFYMLMLLWLKILSSHWIQLMNLSLSWEEMI